MTEPVIPDDIPHALTDIYERGWYAAEDALRSALATAEARNETLERERDATYHERDQVVAALTKCFPSSIALSGDPEWPIVYIDLPTGQVSWHIRATEIPLFSHLEWEHVDWDGHTTAEKYARLASLTTATTERAPTPTTPGTDESEMSVEGARSDISGP